MTQGVSVSTSTGRARLLDERDLVGVSVELDAAGRVAVCFLGREQPESPPAAWLSVAGFREPPEASLTLMDGLWGLVRGEISAMRHDPVGDGLSIEVKLERAADGEDRYEVVLWLDLLRWNPAFKARATRGRQRAGLRFFTTRDRLEAFREGLQGLLADG